MKTKIFALAVALAIPASAQAATLTTPEFHIFTQTVEGGGTTTENPFLVIAGRVTLIQQFHLGGALVQMATFEARIDAVGPINPTFPFIYQVVVMGNGQSATFTVLDDTDFFTRQTIAGRGGLSYSITERIETPPPAALPLFAAGFGAV
jgi:hypothetical protein